MDFLKKAIKNRQLVRQVSKFITVGILNTGIDFLVLNILIFFLGTGKNGNLFFLLKAISFLTALLNSYILNKYWVFTKNSKTGRKGEGLIFITVSLIGFGLNVGIASAIFAALHGSGSLYIANISALVATVSVLAWNFVGYKFFVFNS